MAATTGFRTLYPALIPPGAKHIDGIASAGPLIDRNRLVAAISATSFISDFFVRSTGATHLRKPNFENLPVNSFAGLEDEAIQIFLRLNCLTSQFSEIWEEFVGGLDTGGSVSNCSRQDQGTVFVGCDCWIVFGSED